MEVTDESWFVVRNTPRVTGFLGSSGGGTKPVPLAEEEMKAILLKIGAISKPKYDQFLHKQVEILSGAYMGIKGIVSDVDNDQAKLVVEIDIF
jgi:transcriptional antiterminator NusG